MVPLDFPRLPRHITRDPAGTRTTDPMLRRLALAAALSLAALPALAADAAKLCDLIGGASAEHGLDPDFFARLIWKESRFDVKALSPKGAQGVAQFMPGTARLRGLADPWDPEQAIPASAAYLAEMRARFGNFGLAAAAYNSGEARVERWLTVGGSLPDETEDYVLSITHRPADWFRDRAREVEPRPLDPKRPFTEACSRLPVMATRAVFFEGGKWKPWGVQVAAGPSSGAAQKAFSRLKRLHPTVLGDKTPIILRPGKKRVRVPQRYAVRVGFDSRREAAVMCEQLRARGGACVVMRN
jgi:hypothetical protein